MTTDRQPTEAEQVHTILTRDFTDRYLDRSGFAHFAHSVAYDPANPLCNYEQTTWPAAPNRLSVPIGAAVLGKMHHLSGKEIADTFIRPFVSRADEIGAALRDYPVMLINGHHIDLQAGLALFAAMRGLADSPSHKEIRQNVNDMARISHGVITRGVAPIMIGPRRAPVLPFVRLAQLVANPHFTFPNTAQIRDSGIPRHFIGHYNELMKRNAVSAAQAPVVHPKEYHTLWALAPGAAPDFAGQDEHEGKLITRKITGGTSAMVRAMGCAVIPVRTVFGKGKSPTYMELGPIVPPTDVTPERLHGIMDDLAAFRRHNGQPAYYEGSLE